MTNQELKIVKKHIRSVYSEWHCCALGTKINPIHKEDEARGLEKGQLCDSCIAMIDAHMKDIRKEIGQ